ncbi:molybdenum cofactor sulfurase [Coleophoma crateriformis]|uniref:Molybdenum cofactor sulfurase n=1 Tax=Coleophoma crateriformis TaxID=565419 RepID=A0A3D8QI66_9HELO|nr:molybdenum cofactor sulfurase [Coleophoma crateriformis]
MAPELCFYNDDVDNIREAEYPMLKGATYLDHSGTTLYAKSLVQKFATSMITDLYGNPHSGSSSSILATKRIDDVRLRALQFVKADPEEFDLVFVSNATAAIKLVAEGFRAENGFHYAYHRDSHTSLVGVREVATTNQCYGSDEMVEQWLLQVDRNGTDETPSLFAYPAQSNMNGRRLPLRWSAQVREFKKNTFTLLDAAAFVSTAQLDLSNSEDAPDFTTLSFYKIFGFPDLGALVVKKSSAHMLTCRKYFGGGTVEMVSCLQDSWHAAKDQSIHEQLEDGTLPFHNIMALDSAFEVHKNLYGSMEKISRHTAYLAEKLYQGLSSLRHQNGQRVCKIYCENEGNYHDGLRQGPVVAFNIRNANGKWVSNAEVDKLASIRNIHLRTGNLCNPGGISYHLKLKTSEMKANYAAGQRCGNDHEGASGKPTGVVRVSLGAMSNMEDVTTFIDFIREFYIEQPTDKEEVNQKPSRSGLYVESLMVYPIKSCAGWTVPPNVAWEVKEEGLIWDREWCLVHTGTGQALSQKRYPRMALIRPEIDLRAGLLRIRFHEPRKVDTAKEISVSLTEELQSSTTRASRICDERVRAFPCKSQHITDFFTSVLGVPCNLARFPAGGSGSTSRHSKAHLQQHQLPRKRRLEDDTGSFSTPPPSPPSSDQEIISRPILLSNESPILCINRASLDFLNTQIHQRNGKAASAAVFRANIIVAASNPASSVPYVEDSWKNLRIGKEIFEMLGSCRRCSMVCVDQETAEKNEEPFVTLAKTRRFDNKVFFGEHMCHASNAVSRKAFIKVGDVVEAFVREF